MSSKLAAFLNPLKWFSSTRPSKSAHHGDLLDTLQQAPRPALKGVPMGSVKALPVLARKFFSFENRRKKTLVQGELPGVTPLRNDLFEDDVELVRRKERRLLHETRPRENPAQHDRELALNRLRNRTPVETRLVARD